jgi:glycosyltransferase involved in cell wall biosynthesis
MKVLFVIPHLRYSGTARQMSLLATGLVHERVEAHVCVLGEAGPLGDPLRGAGVNVEALGRTRAIDVRLLRGLRRRAAEFRPDVIHAWGLPALRPCALARLRAPLVLTLPPSPRRRGEVSRLDGWLLRRAAAVVSAPHAGPSAIRSGRPAPCVYQFSPGVATFPGTRPGGPPPNLPTGAHVVLCVGPLEARKCHRDAVWALDILKCLYDDLYLVLVGDGPHRSRLEQFARSIRVADRVRFAGLLPDLAGWLDRAELVWVPSQTGVGTNTALLAMAAARPVVATRVPGLRDVVADGETGFLVEPGDPVALARRSRILLEDDNLRRKFGEAGRRRAAECFPVGGMVERYESLYQEVAGGACLAHRGQFGERLGV